MNTGEANGNQFFKTFSQVYVLNDKSNGPRGISVSQKLAVKEIF